MILLDRDDVIAGAALKCPHFWQPAEARCAAGQFHFLTAYCAGADALLVIIHLVKIGRNRGYVFDFGQWSRTSALRVARQGST